MPFDNTEYLPLSVQVLLGADRLLAKPENWIKGEFSNAAGGFCVAGAVAIAASRGNYSRDAWFAAWDAVESLTETAGSVAAYNDAPETTFSDIKALLQEAIELESAKVAA